MRVAAALAALTIAFTVPARASAESFTVQVASTSARAEAERLVALLAGRDLAAYWVEANVGGKTVYRVRVGSFPTREAAKELAESLPEEFRRDYWVAPEEAEPAQTATPLARATVAPARTPSPTAAVRATPALAGKSDAAALLAQAMTVHGGPRGGFTVVDGAASVVLSYRLKSLDAKTGAPVFTRHVYRRKGKDRLRLEITPIDVDAPARDAQGRILSAPASITVHTPGGAWVEANGGRTALGASIARARIEALGPSGMLRLPLAFPTRGGAAVGITGATIAGLRTLNGMPATRIDATPPPKPYREAALYLDPGTSRLAAARFLTDAGELLLTFSDYRTVAPGLIVPFERVVYRDGTVVSSVEIDGFTLDADLPDSLFSR